MRPSCFVITLVLQLSLVSAAQNARSEEVIVAENPSNSFEPERELELERVDTPVSGPVPSREWHFDELRVVIRSFGTSKSSLLRVKGRVEARGKIYCEDHTFSVGEDGAFELEVPYDGRSNRLYLARIAPDGSISHQTLNFRFKQSEQKKGQEVPETVPVVEFNRDLDRKTYFALGTGITSIRYSQSDSRYTDYRSTVWSLKGAFNYFVAPPVWDLGFSGFVNLTTLSSNQVSDVRFIGANARLGYVFPGVQKPWRVALYGGWYYSTMMADDLSFGYRNLSGPQLYPTLRRAFSNGTAMSGYLKFSLITDRLGLLNLGNHEVATGLGYLFPIGDRTFILGLDYSALRFGVAGRQIDTSSVSLGLSLAM